MSLAFDENGRPFIILREQEKKKRVKGLEAHKVRIKSINLDQYYGCTYCSKSAENISWT